MNDLFWDIFFVIVIIVFAFCATVLTFIIIIRTINICNKAKPKKKYYLIKYSNFYFWRREIVIKAKTPLEAKIKFHKKYKKYDFISIKEIKDE